MAAILAAGLVTGAYAQSPGDSPWMVRVLSVHLDISNKDSTPLGLSINNQTLGEVDVTYFLSPTWQPNWS
jgi:outer membrane protein